MSIKCCDGFEGKLVSESDVEKAEWEQVTIIEVKSTKELPSPEISESKTIPKNKNYYIDEKAKVGIIIAFKVNDTKVISGKIEEIHQNSFVVATKNEVRFTVAKENVIWVKTTDRWPRGVYLALKGVVGPDENRRPN